MSTLDLFIEPPGTRATMKTKATQVTSYVVFVRKWIDTGDIPVVTWHSNELESASGASITLEPARGYDFILKALVRPDIEATMAVDLKFTSPGKGGFKKTIDLPSDEGPVVEREWKVIIK